MSYNPFQIRSFLLTGGVGEGSLLFPTMWSLSHMLLGYSSWKETKWEDRRLPLPSF